MRDQISGTRNGEPWPPPGGEIDLSDAEAVKYCANGLATPVAVKEPVEERDDDGGPPPRSGPGSGKDAWVAYAQARGVEVTDDMTREDIIGAVEG
jgi:hypothetical protein